jgi:hypothetical protein
LRVSVLSAALLEAAQVGFVFRNPTGHLLAGKFSRFRHPDALPAQPGGEKQHQLLFLLWRQPFRRRLNFIELARMGKLSCKEQLDNSFLPGRHYRGEDNTDRTSHHTTGDAP